MPFHSSTRLPARALACAMLAGSTPPMSIAAAGIDLAHARAGGYPYYQDEATVQPGDYFALHCAQACALKKTRVSLPSATIKTVEGPERGLFVRSHPFIPSLFLVRGHPGLREGPVKTWYANMRFQHRPDQVPGDPLKGSQRRTIDIDGAPLHVEGRVEQIVDKACAAYGQCERYPRITWTVRFGDTKRTLAVLGGENELQSPIPIEDFLVWVGDLDGDGKPDMVVRPQDLNRGLEMALYLSSELVPGRPWKPAAAFHFWDPAQYGC
ncbi:hypothetical protein QPK31_19780 [Massilia sp. YIM B02769]|uniref:hypothetical protein n=1 Tax=Massilia sp. YIM B02769 TaxID=3050129 RepID=UPI0025B66FEB|nr:hypothetical protein [Massilia sp. YIM B02769]MDN4060453.1 hypothetical protein [Massilia sp. YIM B02769]